MEHDDIRHRLSEYIDGSIAAREKSEMEEHLRTCTACSDALRELQKTIELIKTTEEVEPPAWMTQKIMAKVHAEAERKKGVFEKLFYPLSIKLPAQVIAVLFLAVTGFAIYQNIYTAKRTSDAPIREFAATQQAPQAEAKRDTLAKADRPAPRSRQVPQTPAYKSLDMKPEYGTPPPPMLQKRAAAPVPVPAQPAEPPMRDKDEVVAEQDAITPRTVAPSLQREQTPPAVRGQDQEAGKREPTPVKRRSRGLAADGGAGSESARSETTLTVSVKNIAAASKDMEATIKKFDGTIISTERIDPRRLHYVLSLSPSHANDLMEKLKSMGAVKEKDLVVESRESSMVFKIELREGKVAVGC